MVLKWHHSPWTENIKLLPVDSEYLNGTSNSGLGYLNATNNRGVRVFNDTGYREVDI
jgi:hypothetical protein